MMTSKVLRHLAKEYSGMAAQAFNDAADRIDELEKAAKGWQEKWKEAADARDELWRKACLWKEDSDELMAQKAASKNRPD